MTGATSLSIDNGVGTVTGTSVAVTPAATTTYTLTATNANGSVTADDDGDRDDRSAAGVHVLHRVAVDTSPRAASSTLAWVVSGRDLDDDRQRGGNRHRDERGGDAGGDDDLHDDRDQRGRFGVALGPGHGDVRPAAGVHVVHGDAARPSSAAASSTLAWVVTGATTLSIDQGVGTVTGTSVAVTPAATTTYTMTATNAAGSVTHSATVTIPAASLLLRERHGRLRDARRDHRVPPRRSPGPPRPSTPSPGKPYDRRTTRALDGQALVWNGADDKFYGVLNGGGAWETGVLVSFDPGHRRPRPPEDPVRAHLSGQGGPGRRHVPVRQADRASTAGRSSPRTARGCSCSRPTAA